MVKLSKPIHTQLVPLLYIIAAVYTVVNLGGPFIGIPGVVFLGIFILTVLFFYLKTFNINLRKSISFFIVSFLPLVLLNSLNSIEKFNSTIYWFLWLMFVISLIKIIHRINQQQLDYILSHVPFILLLASVLLYIVLFPHLGRSIPTKNSLGLFAGATMIASLSINEKRRRYTVFLAAFFILVQSDSRSSLVFSLGIVGIYFLSSFKNRNAPVYILGLILLMGFNQPIYSFFEQKMLKKELHATNLQEAIESAQKERTDLLVMGWELFKERPYLGFGLKSNYYEGRIALSPGAYVHVHNGYLGTLIETGLLITFIVLIFLVLVISRLVRLLLFAPKSFDKIWLFFILFGLIRSYGENYLFFNIGNVFSIFFIFFCLILVVDSPLSFVVQPNRIYHRINNRNRRVKY